MILRIFSHSHRAARPEMKNINDAPNCISLLFIILRSCYSSKIFIQIIVFLMGFTSNCRFVEFQYILVLVQQSLGTHLSSILSSFYSQLFQFQIILVLVQQSPGTQNSNIFCLFISIKAQIFFNVLEFYSLILYFVEFLVIQFRLID